MNHIILLILIVIGVMSDNITQKSVSNIPPHKYLYRAVIPNGTITGYSASQLTAYEYASYTAACTGPINSTNTTVRLYRFNNWVHVEVAGVKAAGNTIGLPMGITGLLNSGISNYARFSPTGVDASVSTISVLTWGVTNGAGSQILVQIPKNSGDWTAYLGNGNSFTAGVGNQGFESFSFSYTTT